MTSKKHKHAVKAESAKHASESESIEPVGEPETVTDVPEPESATETVPEEAASAAEPEGEPLTDATITSEVEETQAKGSNGHAVTVKIDASDIERFIRQFAADHAGLHERLVEASRLIPVHAGQTHVRALNELEILVGQLKLAVPAGVAATDDPELQAALHFLLDIL